MEFSKVNVIDSRLFHNPLNVSFSEGQVQFQRTLTVLQVPLIHHHFSLTFLSIQLELQLTLIFMVIIKFILKSLLQMQAMEISLVGPVELHYWLLVQTSHWLHIL